MPALSRSKLFRIWQLALIPVFIFILIHFLKDLTQDILGIPTAFDLLGDIREDLSGLNEAMVWFYHWVMVNAFFVQIYLLFSIPKTWTRKNLSQKDGITFLSIIYLIVAFSWALILDPRYF